VLKKKHGHVSREHAISLDGLVELWSALATIDGEDHVETTAADVISSAKAGDARAEEAVRMCVDWLAAMASDVALIMGARGGIYLTGDLMDLLGDHFDADAFCRRYLYKGRLSNYVGEIPVYRTLARDLEIIGLATLFD
jgi:glucokinase